MAGSGADRTFNGGTGGGSGAVGGGLALTLRYPNAASTPVPRVPGTIGVTVPLFRGSGPSPKGFPLGPIDPIPGTDFERQGQSPRCQANQSLGVVMDWYEQYFASRGDRVVSTGSSANRSGTTEQMQLFPKRLERLGHHHDVLRNVQRRHALCVFRHGCGRAPAAAQ